MSQKKSTDATLMIIIVLCVIALGYLIYSTIGLLNEQKDSPTIVNSGASKVSDLERTTSLEDRYDEEDLEDEDDLPPLPEDEDWADEAPPALTEPTYVDDDLSDSDPSSAINAPLDDPAPASDRIGTVPLDHYMVLAGSFRLRANAQTLTRQLIAKGYSNASTELFDRGTYAVVLVNHYASEGEARAEAAELNNAGIPARVMQKQ